MSSKDALMKNIKYYRYKNGYSQEKLAELSELSSRYLCNIERGKHSPTLPKIDKIAKALKIEPYMLLKEIDKDEDVIYRMKNFRSHNQRNK